eukprot:IDg18701t1
MADVGRLTHSLIATSVINETRPCALCSSAPEANCPCAFVIRRPLHPLDFSHMRANLLPQAGRFDGTCAMSLYAAGITCANALLKISVSCTQIPTANLSEICERAAYERMKEIAVVPPALAAAVHSSSTLRLAGTHPDLLPFASAPAPAPRHGGLLTGAVGFSPI